MATVLDLGCSVGQATIKLKERFPEAEIWGLDVGLPMVRYAHARAAEQQVPVNFIQALAEDMPFDAGRFDIVFAYILFHELPIAVIPQVIAEAFRVLRPGGQFVIFEFPSASQHLPPAHRFMIDYDSRDNCEPYSPDFVHADFRGLLAAAGFAVADGPPSRNSFLQSIVATQAVSNLVTVADTQLHVVRRGAGPPLLLLVGLGGRADFWSGTIDHFADRFDCISFDHRKCGDSLPSDIRTTVAVMAADALALMDRLGIERADIVGHSLGGAIAQHIAVHAPERVNRLVLSASWAGPHPAFLELFALRKQVLQNCGPAAYMLQGNLLGNPGWWAMDASRSHAGRHRRAAGELCRGRDRDGADGCRDIA